MEFPEFVRLVAKMRELQVAYFTKGRTPTQLREARDAERRVDAALKAIADGDGPRQAGLFDEGGEG
jgi:hypothetical protein